MKKSLLRIALVLLVLAGIGGAMTYRYVFSPVEDYGAKPADSVFTYETMMQKVEQDTASLNRLKDQVVGITGKVKRVTKADSILTVEIGIESSMSSIVCQIDPRHAADLKDLTMGESLSLQGRMVGYTIDTMFGLGNTVEMNYCSRLRSSH